LLSRAKSPSLPASILISTLMSILSSTGAQSEGAAALQSRGRMVLLKRMVVDIGVPPQLTVKDLQTVRWASRQSFRSLERRNNFEVW